MNSETVFLPEPDEMSQHAAAAANLLKVLANPRRLQLLCVLGDDELSVGMLNARVPLSQSALSQHLALLRAEDLVQTRRESQTIFYRVTPGPALDVIHVLYNHFCDAGKSLKSRKGRRV